MNVWLVSTAVLKVVTETPRRWFVGPCKYNHLLKNTPKMYQRSEHAEEREGRFSDRYGLLTEKDCSATSTAGAEPRAFVPNQQPQSIVAGSSLGKRVRVFCQIHVFSEQEQRRQMKSQTRTTHWRHRNINACWNCLLLSGGDLSLAPDTTRPLREQSVGYPCRL